MIIYKAETLHGASIQCGGWVLMMVANMGGDTRQIKVAFDLKNKVTEQEITAKVKPDEIMKKIEFFKDMGLEVQRTYLVNAYGVEIGGD